MKLQRRVKRLARRLLNRPLAMSAGGKKIQTEYPFIYIAALRRTGSKLLAAALTEVPHSFILREPGFPRGCVGFDAKTCNDLLLHGIDLHTLRSRLESDGESVKNVWKIVYQEMLTMVHQVGTKEIRHNKWWKVANLLDDVRFIVTARDPRDICLSVCRKGLREDLPAMRRGMDPEAMAEYIKDEFAHQRAMIKDQQAIKVRYEDLCTNPHIYEEIKAFVNSPIPRSDHANVDINARTIPKGEIRTDRVAAWKREQNPEFLKSAHRVYELVPEYNEFWGYPPEGFDLCVATRPSASSVESAAT